jgi:hypothetical protein
MRIFLVTALAAAVAAAFSAAPYQSHKDVTGSGSITLTKVQACQELRDDLRRNRGVADIATLRHIADHVTALRLAADARNAVRDIDHTGMAPIDLSLLRDDCAPGGIQIPGP